MQGEYEKHTTEFREQNIDMKIRVTTGYMKVDERAEEMQLSFNLSFRIAEKYNVYESYKVYPMNNKT
jgi:hypothetical protein